jgi:hypothetical protein
MAIGNTLKLQVQRFQSSMLKKEHPLSSLATSTHMFVEN